MTSAEAARAVQGWRVRLTVAGHVELDVKRSKKTNAVEMQ